MKTSLSNNLLVYLRQAAFGLLLIFLVTAGKAFSQDLPEPTPHLETLPVGTIIIPMDDAKQFAPTGNGGANRFNLKAYGLIQRLLQNNIPMKWAIKAGKSKDDVDFTATASRLFPSAQGAAALNFSGGPFIVPQGYETIALQVINAFRTEVAPGSDTNALNVAVYQTTTSTPNVDIRYTIVHKPKIAIGQNTGVTSGVHQKLYDFALINDYANVSGTTINNNSCYTIATQPHFDDPDFISNYRDFLKSGGNVLLQCLSITTFENDSPPAGESRFQSTTGFTGTGNPGINTAVIYENGDMPFSQFIGGMNDNQLGLVEDYRLNSGGAIANGTFAVVRNHDNDDTDNSGDSRYYVASESRYLNPNNNPAGGAVFALGGHDYFQSGSATTADNYNAQRMILNALFVPVTRPAACGLSVPIIFSYKSVKLTTDVNGNGLVSPGDTLTWTIVYFNPTPIAFPNFQITDLLDNKVAFSPSLTVTPTGAGTAAGPNGSYTGTGGNINLLAAGATLGVGGKIVVQVKTTVKPGQLGLVLNQTNATGTNVAGVGVKSDALDSASQGVQGGILPPLGSILQTGQTPGIDPTIALILVPTAANATISGRVITAQGLGISRAQITVASPQTGVTKVAMTNPFGYFSIGDLEVGHLYVVSAAHKSYVFTVPQHSFMLGEDVAGLVFAAVDPDGKGGGTPPPAVKAAPSRGTLSQPTSAPSTQQKRVVTIINRSDDDDETTTKKKKTDN